MSLLLNEYSPDFISKRFNQFFSVNNPVPVLERLDEQVYQQLHHNLLIQPNRREKKLEKMTRDTQVLPNFAN